MAIKTLSRGPVNRCTVQVGKKKKKRPLHKPQRGGEGTNHGCSHHLQ